MSQHYAGTIGTKACGVQRGPPQMSDKENFLKKATCISKPDKQDLIDFGVFLFFVFKDSFLVVHLLKSFRTKV